MKRAEQVAARTSHGVDSSLAKNVIQPKGSTRELPVIAPDADLGPAPGHLRTPVRNQRDYEQELHPLKASAHANGFDVADKGAEARCESSCSTPDYNTSIAVRRDGTIQRFLNGKPVPEYGNEHSPAIEMEPGTQRNALGIAWISDAEEYKRSPRVASGPGLHARCHRAGGYTGQHRFHDLQVRLHGHGPASATDKFKAVSLRAYGEPAESTTDVESELAYFLVSSSAACRYRWVRQVVGPGIAP